MSLWGFHFTNMIRKKEKKTTGSNQFIFVGLPLLSDYEALWRSTTTIPVCGNHPYNHKYPMCFYWLRTAKKENWAPAVSHPNSTTLRSGLHSHWPHPSFSRQFHTTMWTSHIPCSILFFHGTGNIFSWWPTRTCWNQLRPILILTFAPSAFCGKEKIQPITN